MDSDKKQQAVLYIEPTRIFFYPGADGAMLQLAFPVDVLSDLEVLNSQKLIDTIVTFFQSQKIAPSEILFVFSSSTTFEKEFPEGEKKEAIQRFLDYVPFDDVISKSFPLNKSTRIIAINGQLYTILKEACEKSGSKVGAVVPYSLLQGVLPELAQKVNIPLMLERFDTWKQFTLIASSPVKASVSTAESQAPINQNKRVFILLGVFGVLIVVLIITVVVSMGNTPPPRVQAPRALPVASPTVTLPVASPSAKALEPSQIPPTSLQ